MPVKPDGGEVDVSATFRVRRCHPRVAIGLLGLALAALLAVPGAARATTPPTEPPTDADASCDTVPTSYPGNGVPVPDGASCAVVTTPAGIPVAEVWAWGDEGGLHWYNYLAEGYTPGTGYPLTMCASEDDSADGLEYECTTDSHFLLFTMSNLFVTWPSSIETDFHYCESVDVVGPDGTPVTGHACGTLSELSDVDDGAPAPPTTPPTSSPPPASSPPPEVPTTEPAGGGSEEPADPDDPASQPVEPPGATVPTTTAPTAPVPSRPDVGNSDGISEDAFAPGAVATPVGSQTVAQVEGAAFPVALVFVLAAALGMGGVGVLAGPSAIAALRRRTR